MPEKILKSIRQFSIYLLYTVLFIAYYGCQQRATTSDLSVQSNTTETAVQKAEDTTQIDTVQTPEEKVLTIEEAVLMEPADQTFKITEDNAIEFFFQYQKKVREQKVRL